jgi:hypothetical protein
LLLKLGADPKVVVRNKTALDMATDPATIAALKSGK